MPDPSPNIAFSVLRDSQWETRGLRGFLEYRDLGVSAVTGGRFGATVARALGGPTPGGGAPRHYHAVGFHLIYVLRGWLRTEFEGLGEVVLSQGDCVAYEGELPQTHFQYSADYEVLQVTMPADFATVPVENA